MKPKQNTKITDRIKTIKERSTYTFTEPLTHMQENPIKQQRVNEKRGKKRKNKAMEILPECRLTLRSKWK